MFRKIILIYLVFLPSFTLRAQQFLSENEAISRALSINKNITASGLEIKQQKELLKSAYNLPNPEFFWESPTGNFYTGSITQSIEFPLVYTSQYKLQKQQVAVSEKQKRLTEAALKYRIKQLYLETQYADSLAKQLYKQDTLYEKIQASAIRQFKAGQIDFLQQTFAETQYGEMHNQYEQSLIKSKLLKSHLRLVTGLSGEIILEPLSVSLPPANTIIPDSAALLSNPSVQLLMQQQQVARQNIDLQKAKALPGLAFGYFNQGERNTAWYNRFRFGITIPLWYAQYRGNINAAKLDEQVLQSKQQGMQQDISEQIINALSNIQTNWQSVKYYQQTGLKKAQDIINTSQRFFVSGEIDYINFMRNNNDAYNIYQKYLEGVKNYNLSVINYQYLMGQF